MKKHQKMLHMVMVALVMVLAVVFCAWNMHVYAEHEPKVEKNSLPIIAMTANAFAEDKERALEAGMNDFLPKPVNVRKMLELLGKILPQDKKKI